MPLYIHTGDWFGAELTLLGEKLSEARDAVGLVVVWRELVICEDLSAVSTAKTLAMPRRFVVRYSALRYRLHPNSPTSPITHCR